MTLYDLLQKFHEENEKLANNSEANSSYAEILARLKDSGAFISNKMMCNLLSKKTGVNWAYTVVEEGPHMARLFFRNSLYEIYRPQAGILEQGGNLGYVIKKLENINWFQEYLSARKNSNSDLMEMDLVTGQKGFIFPPYIQNTLEDFFKHVEIDPNHPENLTFEDHRFEEKKEFKPHNLYYRYMRDKKAGKLPNQNGKNENK